MNCRQFICIMTFAAGCFQVLDMLSMFAGRIAVILSGRCVTRSALSCNVNRPRTPCRSFFTAVTAHIGACLVSSCIGCSTGFGIISGKSNIHYIVIVKRCLAPGTGVTSIAGISDAGKCVVNRMGSVAGQDTLCLRAVFAWHDVQLF